MSNTLRTPIGDISIYIDGRKTNYQAVEVPLDNETSELEGRFIVPVPFISDGA